MTRPLAMLAALAAAAAPAAADPLAAPFQAWSAHCLSPRLTAERAAQVLPPAHDFYDLRPFSASQPSPARAGRTPGTDRRCAVTAPGARGGEAAEAAAAALAREGIDAEVALPPTHADARRPGTALLAARALNPRRLAVVHAYERDGADGVETVLSVERLTPEASAEALR